MQMNSLNRVSLIGHLGADPETKQVRDRRPFVSFSLATSEQWTDKSTGEKRERTEWHRVIVWSEPLAMVASKFLHKGSRVLVEGKLETRKWTDKDGQERYQTSVNVQGFDSRLILLDPQPAKSEAPATSIREPRPPVGWSQELNDEIPF
jgi:single-strand DNA-binding protein